MKKETLAAYWQSCITENYANFKGRASRREYWAFVMFQTIFGMLFILLREAILLVLPLQQLYTFLDLFNIITIVLALGFVIPYIAVSVRRLHDVGRSGWAIFLALVIPLGSIMVFYWHCLESSPKINKYGEVPQ